MSKPPSGKGQNGLERLDKTAVVRGTQTPKVPAGEREAAQDDQEDKEVVEQVLHGEGQGAADERKARVEVEEAQGTQGHHQDDKGGDKVVEGHEK